MSGYTQATTVEIKGRMDTIPFLESISNGRFVMHDKGRLIVELQKKYGDALCEHNGEVFAVELKHESRTTGNLFLEEWSNRKWETKGWMHHLNADILLYYFLDERRMYSMHFPTLKEWYDRSASNYRLLKQGKYDQLNDTWGYIVPVNVVRMALGGNFKEYVFAGGAGNYRRAA